MADLSPPHSTESERAEWEAVVAGLSRTPRLAKLLGYIGELYFQKRSDEINEFQIATNVFGRSEKVFDPSRDSIARVEAYRLRKKLKEYYESDGIDHLVVISLPPGSYVPSFSHRASPASNLSPGLEGGNIHPDAPPQDATQSTGVKKEESSPRPESPRLRPNRSLSRRIVLAVVVTATLLFAGVFLGLRHSDSPGPLVGTPNSAAKSLEAIAAQANSDRVPIRLLCGYEGTPRIGSSGAYWEADKYYSGGIARARPDSYITRTSDPMIFEHWRLNEMKYDIPLKQGPYELHLFFVAPRNEEATRDYSDVLINGKMLLPAFNINEDAPGANVADERIFKDIYPAEDGKLHLAFTSPKGTPSISAIELIPGIPHKQLPIRLVMQSSALKDHLGNLWQADTYSEGGFVLVHPQVVTGTPDPKLYAQERYGHFTYSIPVDTHGRYTLVLHFAELYWAADPGVGRRVFSVYCNGKTLLDNFDIFKEAGSLHALIKTFNHVKPTKEGKLDLTFEPIENYATVTAIEVIDESE